MGLFLFRFWPALVPLALYILWFVIVCYRAVQAGKPAPSFRDGPLFAALLSALLIAVGCFIVLALSQEGIKGDYVPPHMEDGKLVPGQVRPAP